MLAEIKKLKLPMGVWQQLIQRSLKLGRTKVVVCYPDSRTAEFNITKRGRKVANFSLSFLPGCKGIVISHAMEVYPRFKRRGIAKALQPIKKLIARDLRASRILATVTAKNEIEHKVIKDWQSIYQFDNKRTGHRIGLFVTTS